MYGVYFERSNLVINNSTLTGNGTTGLYCSDSYSLPGNRVLVTNSIFWANEPNQISGKTDLVTINYSNIQGGWSGQGNIYAEPYFFEPGHWNPNDDFWIDGDYHLKSQAGRWDPNSQSWVQDEVTSPCIDAGDMASPIGFEPFPNGGIVNMGAYGGTTEASKSYFGQPVCETIIAGDINGDCTVDFADFAIMAAHWLEDNTPTSAVTTTYQFLPDKSTVVVYGGRSGSSTFSVEGQFQLTVDYNAGSASLDQVDTINVWGDSMGDIFHMTELVGIVVNDTKINFLLESSNPSFPDRDMLLELTFIDDSVHLTCSTFYPLYAMDAPFYVLDAVAVLSPAQTLLRSGN